MKKFLTTIMCIMLMLAFTACGSNERTQPEPGNISLGLSTAENDIEYMQASDLSVFGLEKAENCTLTLDFTDSESTEEGFIVSGAGTLDLNGKTLSGSGYDGTLCVGKDATLTINGDNQVNVPEMNSADSYGTMGIRFQNWAKKDLDKAMKAYEIACDGEIGAACRILAVNYQKAYSVRGDINKALTLYEKACHFYDGEACTILGEYYLNTNVILQDTEKAIELFRKSCRLKHARGCINLGNYYQTAPGELKDLEKAKKLFKKACTLGAYQICNSSY